MEDVSGIEEDRIGGLIAAFDDNAGLPCISSDAFSFDGARHDMTVHVVGVEDGHCEIAGLRECGGAQCDGEEEGGDAFHNVCWYTLADLWGW